MIKKIKVNKLWLWGFMLAYLFYFSLVSIMKFNSFSFYDFDLAVHCSSLWNIIHGSIYNPILGIPFLGNHMQVILFLIAPVYAIFSHPLTPLLLQTFALGITALPLYKLSKYLLDENWALIISITYFFYPALGYTNLFEFHPTVFATLFLMLTLYYYEQGFFVKFIMFSVFSMLCQENIPFAVIMFGFLAIFHRRKLKWIIWPIFIGSSYLLISLLLMSYFNNNTVQFIKIYRHLGNSQSDIIINLLSKPTIIFKTLMRKECFIYLMHIFIPLSFVSFFSPLALSLALPFLLQHLLSLRSTELTIFYHYTAEIIPFIFFSFIYGIKFLLKNKHLRINSGILKAYLLSVLFLSNLFLGPYFRTIPLLFNEYKRDYLDIYKDKFITQIPEQASVVATFEFLPHLSKRRNLYSLHHVYMGFYTLSNKRYELPKDTEYALIDFNDFLTFRGFYNPSNYKNLQIFQGDWQVEDLRDTIVLFKKGTSSTYKLCQILTEIPLDIENKKPVNVEDDIELMGFNLSMHVSSDSIDMIFYWKCLRQTEKDINIFIDLLDTEDRLIVRKIHPICYRIFPTNSWRRGQIFKEMCRFLIPPAFLRQKYKFKIGFFDYRNNSLCKVNAAVDNFGRATLMEIK